VLKFGRIGPKGRKMAAKKVGVFFLTGKMKLHFFATGQIGMKFAKNINRQVDLFV